MSNKEKQPQEASTKAANNFVSNVGLDVGTMNLISASQTSADGEVIIKRVRNNYLEVDDSFKDNAELSSYSNITIDDKVYLLGEQAFKLGNVFNRQVQRSMNKGLISAGDLVGMDIVAELVRSIIGTGDGTTKCVYSVPADPIDKDIDNKFHEAFFASVIKKLNYIPVPINEALAIMLSEGKDSNRTGIAISFGAGMTNVAICYQGIPVTQFSISVAGDWIDNQAAIMAGLPVNRITALKEKETFSLIKPIETTKKNEKRHMEIIVAYYNAMIKQVGTAIAEALQNVDTQFPDAIPIIISGGTSKADGFSELLYNIIGEIEYPFEISQVEVASDQLNAVAKGCLEYANRK